MKKLFSLLTLAIGLFAATSQAQVWDPETGPLPNPKWIPRIVDLTLWDNVISNETSTVTNRQVIEVPVNAMAVLQVTLDCSAAGTSNTVFSFNTSLDGVNWTTDFPYTATVANTGTTELKQAKAVATNALARYITFEKWSTTQTNFVTNLAAQLIFLPKP